eukprot:9508092-Karenia_brevis.AAC.1
MEGVALDKSTTEHQSDIWTPQHTSLESPLCDQADVEREADRWAELWCEQAQYCSPFKVDDAVPQLELLMAPCIRAAADTFPIGTGLGCDNVAPRALSRLSNEVLNALGHVFRACEMAGDWGNIIKLVLIVLLGKPDGGRRPIGLFPTIIRFWMRARVLLARQWEHEHFRPGIFGGTGMGAQRAAWQIAFQAEMAASQQNHYAQAHLDLVKAFEKIPHDKVVAAARKHKYNLT